MTNKKTKNKKLRPSSVIRRNIKTALEGVKTSAPVRFDVPITNKQQSRKNRRKRERERFHGAKKVSGFGGTELIRSTTNGTILGTEDERPKTATLKRPSVLDESLKDKVDYTISKACETLVKYYFVYIVYHIQGQYHNKKVDNYRWT